MFSHMIGSLFILLMFSLAMQKLFTLMRSHLFILSFLSLGLWDISVKILLHGISEIFLPMFSSKTFMVSWLIFKYFKWSWGSFWWYKLMFEFHLFLHVAVQISQHHFLKGYFYSILCICPCVELTIETRFYFWALCSVPLVYVPVFMPVSTCFDYSGLVIQFDIRYCDPSYFVLSQNCCVYSGSFRVPYKFL